MVGTTFADGEVSQAQRQGSMPSQAPDTRRAVALPPLTPTATGKPVFVRQRTVRFADCDPAGMVFYPQYLVMLNGLVEDWLTEGLGISFAQLLGQRRVGLPKVALQSQFRAPARMGDSLTMCLQLMHLGNRSFTIAVDYWRAKVHCVQMHSTLVTTSLTHDGAIPIPPDLREQLQRWQSTTGEKP